MSLKNSLEQLVEVAEKRDIAHYNFLKQVLLMASGLIGILVSLHKANASSQTGRIVFVLAIGLLSLGIISLSIALYAEVSVQKTMFLKWKKEVLAQLKDESYRPKMITTQPSKIYFVTEVIGYLSLLSALICLTVYVVVIA